MDAFLISFGVIFVAELGDKSQLMALTFAARYPALPVLVGVALATAVVHAVSVVVGAAVAVNLPTRAINVAAGLAFFGFAAWTLRGDTLDEDEEARAAGRGRGQRSAVVAASTAFFLAELGDKTMLATVTLATSHGPWGTWAGSTLGMVAADALAILAGQRLARRFSARTVRVAAACAFVVFGLVLVASGLRD